jgi:hypothetical protein
MTKVNYLGIEADSKREWLEKALEQGLPGEGCWEWPWGKTHNGYGQVGIDGKMRRVHIIVCEHAHGPMPEPGMHAAHKPVECKSRACFRPDHLRWATASDNQQDRKIDGTAHLCGRKPALPPQQVEFIRNLYSLGKWTMQELADIYSVSQLTIWRIINFKGVYAQSPQERL